MSNSQYESLIRDTAAKYNIPADVAVNQMYAESGGRADAVSPAGAAGLMQFMPATMKDYGYTEQDRFDPVKSADAYGKHMSMLINKYDGDVNKAVMAYNWGQGNLDKQGVEAAPKETRDYLSKVTGTQIQPVAKLPASTNSIVDEQSKPVSAMIDNRAELEAQYKANQDAINQQRSLLAEMQSTKADGTPKYSSMLPKGLPKIPEVAAANWVPDYSDTTKKIKRLGGITI
jgi:hypothetical protein